MIASNKHQPEVEKAKSKGARDANVAELKEKLAETCRLLEEAKQNNGCPLRYNDQ